MNKDKKKSVLTAALKGKVTPVKVVNQVEIADKPMKPMKPTLRLTSDDLPAIKNWSVGKKYTLKLEVEQTSMRQGNEYEYEIGESDAKDKISATFKVTGIESS